MPSDSSREKAVNNIARRLADARKPAFATDPDEQRRCLLSVGKQKADAYPAKAYTHYI
jgi:hypothetical protein